MPTLTAYENRIAAYAAEHHHSVSRGQVKRIARDLYEQRLPGDEPEELEVVPWKLDRLHELILREEFSEGRSVAALFIAREWLQQQR